MPASGRRSLLSVSIVLLGFTFLTATMFGGGQFGPAFRFWPDLVAIIVTGNLLLGLYVAMFSYTGCCTGLNTALLTRFGFVRIGARIPDALLGLTQIGWYGWGTATIAIVRLRFMNIDAEADPAFLYGLMIVFGGAFCWTAYIGYRGLAILSIVSVPLMGVLLAVSLWIAVGDAGGLAGLTGIVPTARLGIGTAITVVFATFVSRGTRAAACSCESVLPSLQLSEHLGGGNPLQLRPLDERGELVRHRNPSSANRVGERFDKRAVGPAQHCGAVRELHLLLPAPLHDRRAASARMFVARADVVGAVRRHRTISRRA